MRPQGFSSFEAEFLKETDVFRHRPTEKCLVLCIKAEERRFWGISQLISISAFTLFGVLQFLVAGKLTFHAEKLPNLRLHNSCFV